MDGRGAAAARDLQHRRAAAVALVNDGNEQATDVVAQLAAGRLDKAQIKPAASKLRTLSTNLKQAHLLLKTDIEQAWVSPHLKRNAARLPLFASYQETFDSLVNFLETMDTFHDQFAALDAAWREAFLARLAKLVNAHRQLAEAADLRRERAPLAAPPLQLEDLRQLTGDLPASNIFTSVYLGHLTGYGILLCRLSELHTA
ncbi:MULTISPECIES: hypothetical protein [Paraburkholderia]|uniref:hypothetical protein n=1 Tax=Paraburkholderia TaxID=1822464 RepID=UPI001FE826D5|nr:hypothetical protein [Paraburkholderia podalyriae]